MIAVNAAVVLVTVAENAVNARVTADVIALGVAVATVMNQVASADGVAADVALSNGNATSAVASDGEKT